MKKKETKRVRERERKEKNSNAFHFLKKNCFHFPWVISKKNFSIFHLNFHLSSFSFLLWGGGDDVKEKKKRVLNFWKKKKRNIKNDKSIVNKSSFFFLLWVNDALFNALSRYFSQQDFNIRFSFFSPPQMKKVIIFYFGNFLFETFLKNDYSKLPTLK